MIHRFIYRITSIHRTINTHARFIREFFRFRQLTRGDGERFALQWSDRYPCLNDRTDISGFDRHYLYHPAWAARIIAQTKPEYHVDFSSTLYFCSLVSAFIPVHFYDFRPADILLDGLLCNKADLSELHIPDRSISSLSCMHVVEHVGLGRYGDPLDPSGDLKAIRELKRVLAPGGSLFFVVPLGKPVIRFNAHRIYALDQILDYFSDLTLKEFALIPDDPADGGLFVNPPKDLIARQRYGCGCFWFMRETSAPCY